MRANWIEHFLQAYLPNHLPFEVSNSVPSGVLYPQKCSKTNSEAKNIIPKVSNIGYMHMKNTSTTRSILNVWFYLNIRSCKVFAFILN